MGPTKSFKPININAVVSTFHTNDPVRPKLYIYGQFRVCNEHNASPVTGSNLWNEATNCILKRVITVYVTAHF